MTIRKGRVLAAGVLCAIAATVAAWSGPLLSATSSLHSAAPAQAATPAAPK